MANIYDNLGNYAYSFQKGNTIPTAPVEGSQIPGVFPSAASEFLQGPPSYYPWQAVLPSSQMQQHANNQLMFYDALNAVGAGANSRQGQVADALAGGQTSALANSVAAGLGNVPQQYGLTQYGGPYSENPYLTQQIQNAANDTTRIMNEQLLPQNRSQAINSGQYGGSRSGIAEGITRRGIGEEIAQLAHGMRFDDYNNWMNRQLQAGQIGTGFALGQAGATNQNAAMNQDRLRSAADIYSRQAGQGMDMNNLLYQRGAMDRAMSQEIVDADKARWDYGQQSPMNWIGQYMNILQGAPQTPQPQVQGSPGLLDYAMGIAAMGGKQGFGWWGK